LLPIILLGLEPNHKLSVPMFRFPLVERLIPQESVSGKIRNATMDQKNAVLDYIASGLVARFPLLNVSQKRPQQNHKLSLPMFRFPLVERLIPQESVLGKRRNAKRHQKNAVLDYNACGLVVRFPYKCAGNRG